MIIFIVNIHYVVFMSPETAVSTEWRKVFTHSYVKQHLVLICIDEAHCISEWLVYIYSTIYMYISCKSTVTPYIFRGVDFRLAFKRIGELRALVDVPFMALTASAPTVVESDVIHSLHLSSPTIVSINLDRPNIYISASPLCSLCVSTYTYNVDKSCLSLFVMYYTDTYTHTHNVLN